MRPFQGFACPGETKSSRYPIQFTYVNGKTSDQTLSTIVPVENKIPVPLRHKDSPVNENPCVVCLVNKKCILYTGCGHMCCCATCAAKIPKCPLCSKISTKTFVFY